MALVLFQAGCTQISCDGFPTALEARQFNVADFSPTKISRSDSALFDPQIQKCAALTDQRFYPGNLSLVGVDRRHGNQFALYRLNSTTDLYFAFLLVRADNQVKVKSAYPVYAGMF
ncbi:hypothetical protein WBP07_24880 [Novosphingobium sp. BL-8A]|uniref:hypothetical protein n=1 Tax=Novosphingobium sp. BL-8A TaxID=3127639 RepID=UPI0037582A28